MSFEQFDHQDFQHKFDFAHFSLTVQEHGGHFDSQYLTELVQIMSLSVWHVDIQQLNQSVTFTV